MITRHVNSLQCRNYPGDFTILCKFEIIIMNIKRTTKLPAKTERGYHLIIIGHINLYARYI